MNPIEIILSVVLCMILIELGRVLWAIKHSRVKKIKMEHFGSDYWRLTSEQLLDAGWTEKDGEFIPPPVQLFPLSFDINYFDDSGKKPYRKHERKL